MNDPTALTIATMLAWINDHRDEPLTLERIAARAGYSPFHFARLFAAATGTGVIAHLRHRRLVAAARRLRDQPGTSLVGLALDSGFDSQEAFTRAFRRTFGLTPGRFRTGHDPEPLEANMPASHFHPPQITLLPERVRLGTLTLAGLSQHFDEDSRAEIPLLWSRLLTCLPLPGQVPGRASYGVISSARRGEGEFDYLAGVEIDAGTTTLPDSLTRICLAPACYAVFRIGLTGGPMHPQIRYAMLRIWGTLLTEAELTPTGEPDFLRNDGVRPPTEPGAALACHIPVSTG